MDPRPGPADPLAAVEEDLDAVESASMEEQVALYGRIHHGLATALAGTATDPAGRPAPGPGH